VKTMPKTNALRMVESAGIRCSVHEYDPSDGKIDGISAAAKIGRDVGTVFKTLVTTGKITGPNIFVVPVCCELDLRKAALAAGDKSIEMIQSRALKPLTGYVHGGCSPLGMKKPFPVFIEETAQMLDTVIVSAGRIGLQMELAPQDLAGLTNAVFCDLV